MRSQRWIRFGLSALGVLGIFSTARAQESRASFDAPVVVTSWLFNMTNVLDFDGDGFMDSIGYWPTGQSLQLTYWRNDGQGGLVGSMALSVNHSTNAPLQTHSAVGDFNGDGLDDVALAVDNWVSIYLSNGLSAPTILPAIYQPMRVGSLVAADFDGDGLDDFAAVVGNRLRLYINQSDNSFVPQAAVTLGPATRRQLLALDVDGSGHPDLVVVGVSSDTHLLIYRVVNSVMTFGSSFLLPSVTDAMPASGDIDGDQDEDIVVFQMSAYWVLRRTGSSSFVLEPPVSGGPATNLVDVDGDGDLDGVCCGGGGGGTPPNNVIESIFRISLNDGSGSFATAFDIQGLGARHIAGAVDLDHDGDVDLVAGRCVYYADGPLVRAPGRSLGTIVSSERGIGDFDRDGDPDLDVGSSQVLANAGDGQFVAAAPVAPAPPPGTQFVGPGFPGDFDSDGDVDLIVEHVSGGSLLAMRLLLNAGGGSLVDSGDASAAGVSFRAIPTAPFSQVPLSAQGCLAEDVDGDGDRDLIVRGYPSAASMIWLNDGAGFFTPGQEFQWTYIAHVGEIDGDALPDLLGTLAISFGAGPLLLHRGLGAGAFASPGSSDEILIETHVDNAIAVVDFDGDGDLDVGAYQSGPVLRLNDGAGQFSGFVRVGELDYDPNPSPHGVFAVDVDQDGLLDVVSYPVFLTPNASRFFRRTGSGLTFALPMSLIFRPSAFSDVDGDGDDDALGGEHWVNNRRFEGAAGGQRRQYGEGVAGSGGVVPTLGARGPFRPGTSHEIIVVGGLGGASLVVGVGTQPANEPRRGGTLLVRPNLLRRQVTLGGPAGVPGAGEWRAARAFTPYSYRGRSFYLQGFVIDPEGPEGIAFTNGLRLTFGE